MYQIDNSTAITVIPASTAAGTAGFFTDGNPAGNIPATILPAEFMNMLMMEMLGVLSAAGVTPSKAVFSQLTLAIRGLIQSGTALYALDTGAANVYNVAFAPIVTALVDGMVLKFKAKTANTGASTFSPNGLAAKPLVGAAHSALQGAEIVAGSDVWVQWNSTVGTGSWVLIDSTGGALQVAAAIQSQQAAQLAQVQSGASSYAADTGAVNAYAVVYAPVLTALVDGVVLRFKAANANTGACTFSPNGLAAKPIVGAAHSALQGGEIIANSDVWVQWNSSIGSGSWILIDSTGGALQVSPATQSQQAVPLQQMAAVVGGIRNGKMSIAAASATATFTADEVAVKSALGGAPWLLSNFSKTINLAGSGVGGMDTGVVPATGYIAVYAIYNPTTGVSALLAVNATSTAAPEIYGGANMPAGYTASALVSVQRIASSLFTIGYQTDRTVFTVLTTVLSTATQQGTATALNISTYAPLNAKSCHGTLTITSSASGSNLAASIGGSGASIGTLTLAISNAGVGGGIVAPFHEIPITTPQTIYYVDSASTGTINFAVALSEYTF